MIFYTTEKAVESNSRYASNSWEVNNRREPTKAETQNNSREINIRLSRHQQ
jgi:hypothetical protein